MSDTTRFDPMKRTLVVATNGGDHPEKIMNRNFQGLRTDLTAPQIKELSNIVLKFLRDDEQDSVTTVQDINLVM